MKHLYHILLPVYIGLLSSCTYHFELDDVGASPKLVLYSYPGSGDTTVVHLSRSLPVSQKGELVRGLKGADVHLSVNGEAVPLAWTDDSIPGVPAQSYYAVKAYEDGDKVNITAAAERMKAVSSATVVPSRFPLTSIKLALKDGEPNLLQFRIGFTDNAQTKDYYALKVERKQLFWNDGKYSEESSTLALNLDDEPLLNTSSGLDDILMIENGFYRNLYYWDDTKIKGKSYTVRLNTNYEADYEDDFITPDGTEHIKRQVKYRISLYSLSEEFYRYLKSLNDQKNNGLGNSELAPIRSTYTQCHKRDRCRGRMQDVPDEMDRQFTGKLNNNKKNEKDNFINAFLAGRNRMLCTKIRHYHRCDGRTFGKIFGICLHEYGNGEQLFLPRNPMDTRSRL